MVISIGDGGIIFRPTRPPHRIYATMNGTEGINMFAWSAAAYRRLVMLFASACQIAGGSSAAITAEMTCLHVTLKASLDSMPPDITVLRSRF